MGKCKEWYVPTSILDNKIHALSYVTSTHFILFYAFTSFKIDLLSSMENPYIYSSHISGYQLWHALVKVDFCVKHGPFG